MLLSPSSRRPVPSCSSSDPSHKRPQTPTTLMDAWWAVGEPEAHSWPRYSQGGIPASSRSPKHVSVSFLEPQVHLFYSSFPERKGFVWV